MLLRCFQKISLFNFTHPRNGVVSSRGEAVLLFVLLVRACPLMAQSGHPILRCECQLSRVKRTWPFAVRMSAF
jgi:hypothetical protein